MPTAQAQDELAVENLAIAGRAAQRVGGTVLVEPVSGAPRYPLRTAADAVGVIDRTVAADRRAQPRPALRPVPPRRQRRRPGRRDRAGYADRVAHVQIADAPGRGEPGTGELDLDRHLDQLAAAGYGGWIGLEYKPSAGNTEASLAWLPRERRAA